MKIRSYPLVATLALASGLTLLASGCSRTDVPTPATAAPATTLGTEIDDTAVTAKVKAALIDHRDTKAFDIKVETNKGRVQLSGFVDSRAQADKALEIARAVQGAQAVEDGMSIKDGTVTTGNQVDDSVVTAKVKSALLADPLVKSLEIGVVTRKGEVQLSGFVATSAQIDHAVAVANGVEGVKSVQNQFELKK